MFGNFTKISTKSGYYVSLKELIGGTEELVMRKLDFFPNLDIVSSEYVPRFRCPNPANYLNVCLTLRT